MYYLVEELSKLIEKKQLLEEITTTIQKDSIAIVDKFSSKFEIISVPNNSNTYFAKIFVYPDNTVHIGDPSFFKDTILPLFEKWLDDIKEVDDNW